MFPLIELADLTTFNPWSLPVCTEVSELLPLLDEPYFHHWPVVDDEQRVVGVISEDDIFRAALEHQLASQAVAAGARGPALFSPVSLKSLLGRRCVVVDRDECPRRALKLLLDHNLSCLPVVASERLIGMITRSDFLRELSFSDCRLAGEPISEHVTPDQEAVEFTASLEEAKLTMDAAGRHYVAVERGGIPMGVVSRRDLHRARLRRTMQEIRGSDPSAAAPAAVGELAPESPALRPGQTVREAAALLAERGLQAVAVVNQAFRLAGVLSEETILNALVDSE